MFNSSVVLATVATVAVSGYATNLCSPDQVSELFGVLVSNGNDVEWCAGDSGWDLFQLREPSSDDKTLMCFSASCISVLAAIETTNLDCVFSYDGTMGMNFVKIAKEFTPFCNALARE